MSDRSYTESEQRLLDQYEYLKDIKEGRRKPQGPPREQKQPQRSADSAVTPTAASAQKLPSRIRLKAITKPITAGEQLNSPPAPKSPLSKPPPPAGIAVEAIPESAGSSAAEQPVQATISRARLAALLKRKQEQQQAQLGEVDTSQPEGQPPVVAAVEAPAVAPANSTQQLASSQPSSQPRKLLQLPSAAPLRAMADQHQQKSSRPEAAADADIDYDAVSSPEYDVNYDAVSSPEYEVSARNKAVSPATEARGSQQAPRADAHLRTCTPEQQDSRKSPAAAARTPTHRNLPHVHESRPNSAAARRRSCSRSPRSSRSRSPFQGLGSREGSRGYSSRKSRGWRRASRSRSRSRSPRGQRAWRRGSPDYGLGAMPVAGLDKQNCSSPSPSRSRSRSSNRSPGPDRRRHGNTRAQLRPDSRQESKQHNPTLFVGDLPPVGFASDDLLQMFRAYGWKIVNARVQGSQCYGFVEFENRTDAEEALHLVELRDEGFNINGTFIRASWAKGNMPDWKKGKAVLTRRARGEGLEGLEAYEHPTARLIRLQAAAAAVVNGMTAQCGGIEFSAAAALPPEGQPIPPGFGGRQLIDYGDL